MKGRRLKDIADLSQFWDAEDLLRNFEQEVARLEQGLGHMVWDTEERRVTAWLSPLPLTPKFEAKESDKDITLKVQLPNVDKDRIKVGVDNESIEVFACPIDVACRPYYMSLDARGTIKPETASVKLSGDVLEVTVLKVKKKRVDIK